MLRIGRLIVLLSAGLGIIGCSERQEVDLMLYGAKVYTASEPPFTKDAVLVDDGVILAMGDRDSLLKFYSPLEERDLSGKFIYPGFNDAHAHFHGYSLLQLQIDLRGTKSFDEVVQRTRLFAEATGLDFIEGRGWDQNDWQIKEFPNKRVLDSLFPETPILLKRVDGHAAIANQAALDYAGVTDTTYVLGGVFMKENGEPTGILIDNAVDEVILPKPDQDEQRKAVLWAQDSLFSYGITSVTDAGIEVEAILLFGQMMEAGELKLRINAMVADYPEEWAEYWEGGPFEQDRLNVQCFKIYLDGALGSRGALLLEPYSDDPGNYGLMLKDTAYFRQAAEKLRDKGWQLAVHAIGDSANRYALDLFADVLGDSSEYFRWRIEHAQIVNQADQPRFGEAGVIASVQPTHATSDMYWAGERIGQERLSDAYAFRNILKKSGMLVFGTDFPVEHISPFETFRAAVFRQDTAGFPPGGFQPDQRLDPLLVLKAMTAWPAYASFEEDLKGKLEPGMYADFVVMDEDLMNLTNEDFNRLKVFQTWINGEMVYQR